MSTESIFKVGASDGPITLTDHDHLGFTSKAKALSRFITNCETPMTIGIQGGWGTGKTSLMNLINAEVQGVSATVWLNTWQYAQVHDDDKLPLWIIAGLARKLMAKLPWYDAVKQNLTADNVWGFFRVAAAKLLEHPSEDIPKSDLEKLNRLDEASTVELIHEVFKQTVTRLVGKEGRDKDRVVFFIDDIDRIRPETAVALLEAIKNFVEVPKCVFILAVDFEVVRAGLGDRERAEGRDFFEKIVQVPYSLRPHTYNSDAYVVQHLRAMEGLGEADFIGPAKDKLRTLISATTRTNPRTIKRALNLYAVLCNMADHADDIGQKGLDGGHRLIIFALACIQVSHSYHTLFDYLTRSTSPHLVLLAVDEQSRSRQELVADTLMARARREETHDIEHAIGLADEFMHSLDGDKDDEKGDQVRRQLLAITDYLTCLLDRNSNRIIDVDEAKTFASVLDISKTTLVSDVDTDTDAAERMSRRTQVSFRDLLDAERLSDQATLWFQRNPSDPREHAVVPVFEGTHKHKYVINAPEGKRPAKGKHQNLTEVTRQHLRKANPKRKYLQIPNSPEYWLVEDPGRVADGRLLSEVIEEYREMTDSLSADES